MFFLFLISNMIMGVNNLNQIEENREKIDEQIIKFYEKNRIIKCNFDIDEKLRKVELIYDGKIYQGFINEKNKPYGEWRNSGGFSIECYMDNKKYFILNNYKNIEYYDEEGFYYETRGENITNLYISINLDGKSYSGKYKIENGEIKLLARDVQLYKKGWMNVENILDIIFNKNPNFARLINK